MKRLSLLLLILAGVTAFSAAQTQTADSDSFRQEGIASWYGAQFAGRPTASGEIFDPSLFTAAHKTLPFGTVLTVTNTHNNRRVTVRINDRGPFVAARIIDLSTAAAEVLDMISTGTAPVVIERAVNTTPGPTPSQAVPSAASAVEASAAVIPALSAPPLAPETAVSVQIPAAGLPPETANGQPAEAVPPPVAGQPSAASTAASPQVISPQTAQAAASTQTAQAVYNAPAARLLGAVPQAGSAKSYRLQVGAYKVPRNAVDAFNKLKNAGLNPAYEQNGDFYRVVLAGLKAGDISSIAQTLGNSGFREAIIREESGN